MFDVLFIAFEVVVIFVTSVAIYNTLTKGVK